MAYVLPVPEHAATREITGLLFTVP
jgi:hypothetical protein